MTSPEALTAHGIRVRRGDGPWVLDDASINVPAGRIVGLSGPSGAGKSTLARVLCGLDLPQAGYVRLNGRVQTARRGSMSGQIGMLFQSPRRSSSPRLLVREHIAEAATLGGRRPSAGAVREAADAVGLTSDLLERRISQVSDGQLQRACLARAALARPAYLICDEATAMLDLVTTASITGVVRRLAEGGLGVLAISHDAELLAAWADETYVLRGGVLEPVLAERS